MRLIAGELGGRKLRTVIDKGLRPAMGRTREAIFSMLEARGFDWGNKNVMDLFAGCGSLALEAMSRGAEYGIFVDNAFVQCQCIAENINDLALQSKCHIIKEDVLRFLRKPHDKKFDLVFIDPPYRQNMIDPALHMLSNGDWLNAQAFIIAEIEKGACFRTPANFITQVERLFGQTCIHIWTLQ